MGKKPNDRKLNVFCLHIYTHKCPYIQVIILLTKYMTEGIKIAYLSLGCGRVILSVPVGKMYVES